MNSLKYPLSIQITCLYSVSESKERKPYLQGQLDGYCGVYSMVNAVHYLCGPLSTTQAETLLLKLMRYLEPKQSAFRRLTNGTMFKEIVLALDHIITRQYPIKKTKPYNRNKNICIDILWCDITNFLSTHNGIVLMGMDGKHGHWSLVKKITPRSMLLFDSDRLYRLPKRYCTTDEEQEALHILQPTHVLFLWATQPGGSK